MKYYFKAFKNYANCNGRTSRKEYWLFMLFHYIVIFIMSFLDGVFGFYSTFGVFSLIYMLVSICPALCIQIRRLHDVGKSGFWWFCNSIPFVSLYVLYLRCKAGDSGFNYYGAPPNYTPTSEPFKSMFTECPECGYIAVFEEKCPKCGYVLPGEVQKDIVSEVPRILYCRKCGVKLFDDAQFCEECGTEIITKVEEMSNDMQ